MPGLIVKRTIGMGDTGLALAATMAFKKANPDIPVWFQTTKNRSSWVNLCEGLESTDPPQGIESRDLNLVRTDTNEDRYGMMCRALGVAPEAARIDLDATIDGRWEGYTLLAPFCGGFAPTRSLPKDVVEELIGYYEKLVVLTGTSAVVFEGGVETEVFTTSELDVVELILSCDETVSVDTGPANLAAILGKPTTIVYTHILPESRSKYFGDNVRIVKPFVPCSPCGDFKDRAPCQGTDNYAMCARAMTASYIVGKDIRPKDSIDVLFVVPFVGIGGAETRLQLIAQEFDNLGIKYRVVSTHEDRGKTADLLGDKFEGKLATSRDIAHLIERTKPSSIIFHHSPKVLQALERSSHKPKRVIWECHTVRDDIFHKTDYGMKYITNIVASSKAAIPKDVGDIPVEVIWNGVDIDRFENATPEKNRLKGKIVGAVSRFDSGKNLDLLIDSITVNPEWSCLLVGSGPSEKDYRYLASGYGVSDNVEIVPPPEEVAGWYKAMTLVCLPTDTEGGMANSVIEAMVAGVPVAVTRVSEFPEVFEDSKDILFITKDIKSIVDVLNGYSLEELKEIGRKGKEKAQRLFSSKRMVGQYLKILGLSDE